MGCDIHCYVEFRRKKDEVYPEERHWQSFGGRINPGRNYLMFSIMAGVRTYEDNCNPFPVRGFPEDAAYHSRDDNYLFINDQYKEDKFVTSERAKYYVEKCGCKYRNDTEGKPTWVSHPDWHSHSWITLEEFGKILNVYFKKENVVWENEEKGRLEFLGDLKDSPNLKDVDLSKSWINIPFPHDVVPEYQALWAAMERLESLGYETRLIFWFDN